MDADSSRKDLNFSKGIVITADTTIEESHYLFRRCVKVHSTFSEKTLYLHFITEEQQRTWVEAIQRAIHLQRSSKFAKEFETLTNPLLSNVCSVRTRIGLDEHENLLLSSIY